MRDIIDLTLPLGADTPLYPGDPAPATRLLSSIARGDPVTASQVEMGVHTGTHVDFPAHFLAEGKTAADYSVKAFTGRAAVLDLTDVAQAVSRARLQRETIPAAQHILLKTRNSVFVRDPGFVEDYVFLEPDAARYLLGLKPRSLGIDYYSLDPADSENFPAHRLCAESGLPVFVCLDLSQTGAGSYGFAGLPLHMPALEGLPVRAIVWRTD